MCFYKYHKSANISSTKLIDFSMQRPLAMVQMPLLKPIALQLSGFEVGCGLYHAFDEK